MDQQNLLEEELKKLQGSCQHVGYERDGIKDPEDDEKVWKPLSIFENDSFEVRSAEGTVLIKGIFTLYPDRNPNAIDYHDTFGEYAGETF